MDELSIDNILYSEDEIMDLFKEGPDEVSDDETKEKNEKDDDTIEVNPDDLFGEPESVDSNADSKEQKEDTASKGQNNSSSNFYSSIANALVEDGIFQNLTDEAISKIETAEDFAELFKEQQRLQLDERQKRIDEALNYGVEPTEIQRCEQYLNALGNINEDKLNEESTDAENLRKNLIYQDYINRGFSKDRAVREVERSLKAGTDIEDAKEAVESIKEFYTNHYKNLVDEAKKAQLEEQEQIKKDAENFRKSILENDKAFGEIELDKATRQRVYDTIMKPVYVDSKTGEKLTLIQKYESENRQEFLKNIGLFYVLTDGFKSLNGLVKDKVKKEVKKGLRELEKTINNTSRTSSGALKFTSGVSSDPESKFSNWDLDV